MKAKRFFALLPALVLTFSLLALSFCASAASVGMSRKKAVLVVGQSYQLSLTGTKKVPTWKTSDKKIVAVGKNGTVKGISKGTATVTATHGNEDYLIEIGYHGYSYTPYGESIPKNEQFFYYVEH